MKKVIIETKETSKPIGTFSKAIKITDPRTLIFVSGQAPRTKDGEVARGDIRTQTRQVFENIEYVLQAAGATLKDIVKLTTFIRDADDYSGYNEVRRQYFEDGFPASSTVVVKDLVVKDILIEVEVVAAL